LKNKIIILLFSIVVLFTFIFNSTPGPKPTPIKLIYPKSWPKPPTNIFANNPLTEEGFQLGKKLFYDGLLSKDGYTSCASCHQPFAAFCTYEHDFSHGYNNGFTTRNAPGLFNLAWMNNLHWDGGINHLEVQPLAPITDTNQMAETIQNILLKLKKDVGYSKMFTNAFGTPGITSQRLLKAIAQFSGSLISANSKYDKVQNGTDSFTVPEQRGYTFFKAHCNTCHIEPLFTNNSFKNNGLAINSFTKDVGRMGITGDRNDSLKFKVPSLRNVALTYPYMHDGRFFSLPQAIEHYANGILPQPTLDSALQKKIAFTNNDKANLIYFLRTLTDSSFCKNPRYAQ
jgi:cytochrome c peroxidase